jgi:transcriptional regulator with XRE-family HTH domain
MSPRAKRRTPHEEVGGKVRATREALGLSQAEVARAARLHTTYISKLELGKVNMTIDTLAEIAHALDVDLATLVIGVLPQDLRGRWDRKKGSR